MKNLTLLLLLILSFNSYASREGNGGDVLVCIKEGMVEGKLEDILWTEELLKSYDGTVELYDFYEAREKMKGIDPYNLGGKELNVEEKIEIYFSRIKEFAPAVAFKYREDYKVFFENAVIGNFKLEDIPDTGSVLQPLGRHCEVIQLVIRRETDFEEDNEFVIRKDLWELLDNDNKAGVIAHELIYKSFVDGTYASHKDSTQARYFNVILAADIVKEKITNDGVRNDRKKIDFFKDQLKLWRFGHGGVTAMLATVTYYSLEKPNNIESFKVIGSETAVLGDRTFQVSDKKRANFHKNGTLRKLILSKATTVRLLNQEVHINEGLFFHSDGSYHCMNILKSGRPFLVEGYGEFDAVPDHRLCLFEDGKVQSLNINIKSGFRLGKSIIRDCDECYIHIDEETRRVSSISKRSSGPFSTQISIQVNDPLNEQKGKTLLALSIEVYPDGSLKKIAKSGGHFELNFSGRNLRLIPLDVSLSPSGEVLSGYLASSDKLPVNFKNSRSKKVVASAESFFKYYPGGSLSQVLLRKPVSLETVKGEKRIFEKNSRLYLNEQGLVVEVEILWGNGSTKKWIKF